MVPMIRDRPVCGARFGSSSYQEWWKNGTFQTPKIALRRIPQSWTIALMSSPLRDKYLKRKMASVGKSAPRQ